MVVVAGWLILRWLHQKLWPKEPTMSSGGVLEISDIGVGTRREYDLLLAPPGRLRRPNCRTAGAYIASLQNAENELRRRNEEEKRWRRTMREEEDTEKNNDEWWRQKEAELVRLHAEVESLEAVVEMRGEEVRRLRKQLEGREREEEEEVEMMWERVSKVVMKGKVEEVARVREASTQTEGAPTSQSLGKETIEDDFQQQKTTKARVASEASTQDEIKGCENVRRSKEVVRGREEDRFSLESGYFTHSDEETSSISSSPCEDSQITCDKDLNQISDPTPNCDLEGGVSIEKKPKKSPVHERRPSRFLI